MHKNTCIFKLIHKVLKTDPLNAHVIHTCMYIKSPSLPVPFPCQAIMNNTVLNSLYIYKVPAQSIRAEESVYVGFFFKTLNFFSPVHSPVETSFLSLAYDTTPSQDVNKNISRSTYIYRTPTRKSPTSHFVSHTPYA